MKVYSLACRADNFCHLLYDPSTKEAALFDASDAGELINQLEALEIIPTHLFLTHHHMDHIHGVQGLVGRYPDLKIYQPAFALSHSKAQIFTEAESISFAGGQVQTIATPYHTLTSTCYQFEDLLFTGDSLFVAGCGRMFEGTKEQLYAAFQFFSGLPEQTKVFVGHDYAEVNLRFALSLEPDNEDAKKYLAEFSQKKEADSKGSRTSIGQEKLWNPFFRFLEPAISKLLASEEQGSEVDLLYQVRLARDIFL